VGYHRATLPWIPVALANRKRSAWLSILLTAPVIPLAWIISRLPLQWIFVLGGFLGNLMLVLSPRRRHICEVNIAKCFPHLSAAEQRAFVVENFRHTAIGILEATIIWLNPGRDLESNFVLKGLEHVHAAQADGSGVLLIGCHFTSLDILAPILGKHFDLGATYRVNKNPLLERLQREGRNRFANHIIDRNDMRRVYKLLRRSAVVWYLPDQDYGAKHATFTPFFGVPAATITATSRIAKTTQAKIILLRHIRDTKTGTWELVFSPALEDFPSDDANVDAERLNALIESQIRHAPEQYLWSHRRFKTRPPGEAGFY